MEVVCVLCGSKNTGEVSRISGFTLFGCRECGMVFVYPRPEATALDGKLNYWGKQDVVDEARLKDSFSLSARADHLKKLKSIENIAHGKGKLLDIGCATGAFLAEAGKAGWECRGVEASPDSSRYAVKTLGIPVTCGDFINMAFEPECFDAVTAFEVIEHLEKPADFFGKAHAILRKGGVLALSTPNFSSLTSKLLKDRWWVVSCPDEHISLFTPKALSFALGKCGLKVVSMRTRYIDLANTFLILLSLRTKGSGTYYRARESRDGLKKNPLLRFVFRGIKPLIDMSFGARLSPLYGRGEQILCYAQKL